VDLSSGQGSTTEERRVVLWIHLVAAAVWLGGLITLGAVVVTLREVGVERSVLQAVARQFGRLSWTALGVSVLSGGWMAVNYLSAPLFPFKVAAVAVMAGLAGWHQFAAKNQSPRTRGMFQGLILLASLLVFGIGVAL
jgi:putative copper export protein